ncbi:MAG TPA: NUDIX domain-containing protein [Candidatus Paceibacterota bacterium]|nr:NUDIX domain-containing protein [Candidatus Paceibacterota bacterium]
MKYLVVNESDEVIATKERGELLPTDIVRVSALWLTNSQGEVLLAKRAASKKYDASKWGPAVAGTVEEGESYEQNMVKEIQEELGIEIAASALRPGPYHRSHGRNEYFSQWYFATVDLPIESFTVEPKEVDELRWVSPAWIAEKLASEPDLFIKTAPASWPKLLSFNLN